MRGSRMRGIICFWRESEGERGKVTESETGLGGRSHFFIVNRVRGRDGRRDCKTGPFDGRSRIFIIVGRTERAVGSLAEQVFGRITCPAFKDGTGGTGGAFE
jgi:hypothetical protein